MGTFKDSAGKVVRDGDTVEIVTTYNGHQGQGQKCPVYWRCFCGAYEYKYRVGNMYACNDFESVHEFYKVTTSKNERGPYICPARGGWIAKPGEAPKGPTPCAGRLRARDQRPGRYVPAFVVSARVPQYCVLLSTASPA